MATRIDKKQYKNAKEDSPSVIIAFSSNQKLSKYDLADLAYQLKFHIPNNEAISILRELKKKRSKEEIVAIKANFLKSLDYNLQSSDIKHIKNLRKVI